MRKISKVKHLFYTLALLGLIFSAFSANAKENLNIKDPQAMVCDALARVGMACGSEATSATAPTTNDLRRATQTPLIPTPTNTGNSVLTAAIYNSGRKNDRSDVVLVRVPGSFDVYEIIGGKRHLIPTKDIFYDYGFRDELVQNISFYDLQRYPRVKLLKVKGNNKIYYLTEVNMVRLVPSKKILESYGDRDEDIVVISKKEFSFYAQNQFVFLEKPLKRDIYQIVSGDKRYVTPSAIQRMRLRDIDVAPVNQVELSYYKTASPIVF